MNNYIPYPHRNDDVDGDGRPSMSPALPAALAARPLEMARRVQLLQLRVHDEDTLLDLMFRVSAEAFKTIGDVDWAGVSAQFDGAPFTMAHTHERVLIVDERQYQTGDGPCLLALRTRTRVLMSLAEVTARWPVLGAVAEHVGVHSFLAVPAPAFEVVPAASLNLYSSRPEAFVPADNDSLTVLTQYLSRGVTEYLLAQGESGSTIRLQAALEQRKVIDIAVGVLMGLHPTLDPFHARDLLYQLAGTNDATVVHESESIIGAQTRSP